MGDKPITVTSVLKEFQGLKDKFKNEDEDDCELWCRLLLFFLPSFLPSFLAGGGVGGNVVVGGGVVVVVVVVVVSRCRMSQMSRRFSLSCLCGYNGSSVQTEKEGSNAVSVRSPPPVHSTETPALNPCETRLPRSPSVSPYQDLEKATVLQECRVFSDSNVVTNHPRRCGMLITKLLYILTQGETLSSSETTEVREA